MKIRKANLGDAKEIFELRRKTISTFNMAGYSDQQLKAFSRSHSLSNVRKQMKVGEVFCLEDNGEIIRTIDISGDRIGSLFIKDNFIGKGYGGKLLKFAQDHVMKKGIKKVWLYSTPFAEGFYKKERYKVVSKGTWSYQGVELPEIKMEKEL